MIKIFRDSGASTESPPSDCGNSRQTGDAVGVQQPEERLWGVVAVPHRKHGGHGRREAKALWEKQMHVKHRSRDLLPQKTGSAK